MIDLLRATKTGYRLQYFEVFNWGTFDSSTGQVYRVDLDGDSALLVGQNGSGKSTLVDALLTMLVPPGVRNYNVAAGAKKRERDERTYIKGAVGTTNSSGQIQTEYLRPDPNRPTIILACFGGGAGCEDFTIGQLMSVGADRKVDKTYLFADGCRTITDDLADLDRTKGSAALNELKQRGFQSTIRYVQYAKWLSDRVNFRPRATNILNQTVAVKDIQSLNQFVRDHMLEHTSWQEHIDRLLDHFTQLSQSYETLVHLKRKVQLLAPLKKQYARFEKSHDEIQTLESNLNALDSFFQQHISQLSNQQCDVFKIQINENENQRVDIDHELQATDALLAQYSSNSDATSELRLQQLPSEIASHRQRLKSLKRQRKRIRDALATLGLRRKIESASVFDTLLEDINKLAEQLQTQLDENRTEHSSLTQQTSQLASRSHREESILNDLRSSNNTAHPQAIETRDQLAKSLGMLPENLPMVCELLYLDHSKFKPTSESERWQAGIENALAPIAHAILIPNAKLPVARNFIETSSLRNRTVSYLGYPDDHGTKAPRLKQSDLLSKFSLRREHDSASWLVGFLLSHFRFALTESLTKPEPADNAQLLTPNNHQRFFSGLYKKVDGSDLISEAEFVFVPDPAVRIAKLESSLRETKKQIRELEKRSGQLTEQENDLNGKLAAAREILSTESFEEIDSQRCDSNLESLQAELKLLESSTDVDAAASKQIEELRKKKNRLSSDRDALVSDLGRLKTLLGQSVELYQSAQSTIQQRAESGELESHRQRFDSISAQVGKLGRTISELSKQERATTERSMQKLNRLREKTDPSRQSILATMQRFLIEFPEHQSDLDASIQSAAGFLDLLRSMEDEDLPRFEQRFHDRLNQKIVEQLGVFHANLEIQRQEILGKLDRLNESLSHVEYSSGTHMRLTPQPSKDHEIRDFQRLLKQTLTTSHDAEASQSDNSQFTAIQQLLDQLRSNDRWTNKVTDVRSWFEFAAEEIDTATGQQVGFYKDSAGRSGGEKAKLAFTILAAGLLYQFNIDPLQPQEERFHFIVVDEMFSKVDDRYARYALELFERFGFQLLIVAPLDAKAKITQPFVSRYLHTFKDSQSRCSTVCSISVDQLNSDSNRTPRPSRRKPR